MKKYIIPTLSVVIIDNEVMLADSGPVYNPDGSFDDEGNVGARDRAMFDWGAIIEGEDDDE